MNKEQRDIRTKSIYVLKNVILFSIIYFIVIRWLFDLWYLWQIECFDVIVLDHWEFGLMGLTFFSLLYIIDKDVFFFRIDHFNEFMITFFLSWLIGDFADFLFVISNIKV